MLQPPRLSLALYQPDIPQNVGAAIRLCACLGLGLEIIEPCSFPWDGRKIRESALDYVNHLELQRHSSWSAFTQQKNDRRVILMTTKASLPYLDFHFQAGDILLAGRESSGVPDDIHAQADARVIVPLRPGLRSMNIINAAAMIVGEAMRQTGQHNG